MRKIREVLRLKFEADLSHERIAAATGVSKGAVTKYLQRARDVGLGWPLPTAIDDAKLAVLLFPSTPPRIARHAEPDFAHLHQELKRKGVTLQLLWEEYAVAHPGHAYRYSQFGHSYIIRASRGVGETHRSRHRASGIETYSTQGFDLAAPRCRRPRMAQITGSGLPDTNKCDSPGL
jgi:hypothetical protein